MSVAPLAPVSAAPPAQAVTGAGDLAPAAAVDVAPGNPGPAPQPTAPTLPADPVLQALDVTRAAAAGRQASLAPLLADLAQAIASPALSGPTKAAIAQVLALQTPTDGPFTAKVFKDAVAQSGLFLEAHLARLPASGQAPPDLKAALLVLQRVLAAVLVNAAPAASKPATSPPPTGQSATPPPAAPNLAAPLPAPAIKPGPPQAFTSPPAEAQATPGQTPLQTPAGPPAQATRDATATPSITPQPAAPVFAAEMQPQTVKAASPTVELAARVGVPAPQIAAGAAATPQILAPQTAPQTAPPAALAPPLQTPAGALIVAQSEAAEIPLTAPLPDSGLPTLTPPRDDAPLDPRSALLFLQRAFGAVPTARPGPTSRSAAPAPPLRQSATAAQAAEIAALPGADEATIAQHLAGETDQALARLTLHQLASLPERPSGPGGPAWVFELPLATPQGAAIAQFVIEHDAEGSAAASAGPSWKARFSIDLEPLGPVHIHLRVGRENSAVTLWAEREGAVARLRGQGAALGQALGAEVVIHPGAPGRSAPPPGPGRFVDQSS